MANRTRRSSLSHFKFIRAEGIRKLTFESNTSNDFHSFSNSLVRRCKIAVDAVSSVVRKSGVPTQ